MILISGEALIDLIPDPVKANAYDAVLGGSPYNVAIGLARLGSRTAFVSRISADGNGEALLAALADNGVNLEFRLARCPAVHPRLCHAGDGQDRFALFVLSRCDVVRWPLAIPDGSGRPAGSHLHVGSFSAIDPRHGQTVIEALEAVREKASVSFDPNIRPLVTPDRDSVDKLVERQASLAHMVKASEEDLEWLYPGRAIEESLAAWAKLGPRFCVATLGERGALAVLGGERIKVAGAAWSMWSIRSALATVSCPLCSPPWIKVPL